MSACGQDIDSIHALETAASMAASGAASVKGGNWQIFDKFVEVSGANVFLNTKVSVFRTTCFDSLLTYAIRSNPSLANHPQNGPSPRPQKPQTTTL